MSEPHDPSGSRPPDSQPDEPFIIETEPAPPPPPLVRKLPSLTGVPSIDAGLVRASLAPRPASLLAILAASLVILGCGAVLHLWGLERTPFHTKGEPREGVVVQGIAAGNGWVLPRRNGVELPAKPPLFHWLAAIAAAVLGGVDERATRLPSAILSGVAALLVVVTGARLWGVRAALIAGLALLTSFEWLRAATSARVDMTLTAGLTAACCSMLMLRAGGGSGWLILMYLGIAWAVLSKGPVGVVLPILVIVAVSVADRSLGFARRLHLVRGLLAVLLISGTWYVLAALQGGRGFLEKQIIDENALRFIGGQRLGGGHEHSILYMVGALAAGLLPWTFVLPSVALSLWRSRSTLTRGDARVFLVIWAAVVFATYALATAKRGVYLLALYPAVFLLVGWWFDSVIRNRETSRWLPRVLAPVGWVTATLLAVLAFVVVSERIGFPFLSAVGDFVGARAAQDIARIGSILVSHGPFLAILLGAGALAAAVAAGAATARSWTMVFIGWFAATAAVVVAVRQIILPDIARADTRATFVTELERAGDLMDLYFYRRFDYGTVFYWRRNIPVYEGNLSAAAPAHLLMAESDWLQTSTMERRLYSRVPLIESGRSGNLGRVVLVQRAAVPGSKPPGPAPQPEPAPQPQ